MGCTIFVLTEMLGSYLIPNLGGNRNLYRTVLLGQLVARMVQIVVADYLARLMVVSLGTLSSGESAKHLFYFQLKFMAL